MKSCHPDLCPGMARFLYATRFDGYGMQSMDSFFCGLKLGLDIAYGLKHYDGHLLGDEAEEDVRRNIFIQD